MHSSQTILFKPVGTIIYPCVNTSRTIYCVSYKTLLHALISVNLPAISELKTNKASILTPLEPSEEPLKEPIT